MSDSIRTKTVALAAGLSGLLVAYAIAQPGQPGQPVRPPTPPTTGAPTTPQPGVGVGVNVGTDQPMQTARGENREVNQYFAECLLAKNQAEVELSKLALERSQNPQVKQFAQQLIADHQAVIQKLQPFAGTQRFGATGAERPRDIQQTNFDTPVNTSGQVTVQPGQVTAQGGQMPGREQTPGIIGQPTQPSATGRTTLPQIGQGNALTQVATIEKQIGDRILESTKEKLQQKQGAEFDHCYVGTQIMCHVHMTAALEVLKEQTSGQLRQVIQEAQPKVKQHLTMAEDLGEQLMKSSSRQAERPSTETVPRVPR